MPARGPCGNTPSRWVPRCMARSRIPAARARRRSMRISRAVLSVLAVPLLLGVGPSAGFDGNSPSNGVSALEAFRSGTQALKVGETDKAVTSLQYAAENGYPLAQWKLGRMY